MSKFFQGRKFRILVVDDHPLMRAGFGACIALQPDMEVCGEAKSAEEAIVQVEATGPDAAIVDIQLADSNGIDLISDLHEHNPRLRLLVVSAFDESLYAERVLRAGAHGYISKRDLQGSFVDALRLVLAGERSLSNKMTQRLLGQAIGKFDPAGADSVQKLSNRELEVFQLIGRGITTGAIAKQLLLSVHTIDSHREKIRHKLGIANGTELMQRSVQWVLENG